MKMLSSAQFESEWQRMHHFPMDLSGDTPFYYGLYCLLADIAGRYARHPDDHRIMRILMYVENTVAIGLDRSLGACHACVEDEVWRWCDEMGMPSTHTGLVRAVIDCALEQAPESSLRRWVAESLRSGRFARLSEVLRFFVLCDDTVRRLFPSMRCRESFFLLLAKGDTEAGRGMLTADLAFNWLYKGGYTLARLLARLFTGGEDDLAARLRSVKSRRMDAYTVMDMASDGTVTLQSKDGMSYSGIRLFESLPAGYAGQCLLAQLVTYMDKTYVGGPVAWHGMELYERWCSRRLFYGIEDREIDDACDTFFTTRDGRRLCLQSDLFDEPIAEEIQAYDPAADADKWYGLHVDEFFDWMDCHADRQQELIRR